MRKNTLGRVGFGLLPIFLCTFGAHPAFAEEHTIKAVATRGLEAMFFEPSFLVVEPGDRVRFLLDDLDHQPQSVFTPNDAEPWRAEIGKSITVTLNAEGIYVFDCAFHNVMGMTRAIVVGEPTNLADALRFVDQYWDATVFVNKNRRNQIWHPTEGAIAKLWPELFAE
ncbi:MAG: plastocyanin/azurin family copper-binding protein [Pseudomonadota bacterium]